MGILAIIAVGLVAAIIARVMLSTRQPMGWVITLVLGVAGSIIGALAGTLVSPQGTVFDCGTMIIVFSAVGAVVVLGLANVGHRLWA